MRPIRNTSYPEHLLVFRALRVLSGTHPKLRPTAVILDGPKLRNTTVILDGPELQPTTAILDGPKLRPRTVILDSKKKSQNHDFGRSKITVHLRNF